MLLLTWLADNPTEECFSRITRRTTNEYDNLYRRGCRYWAGIQNVKLVAGLILLAVGLAGVWVGLGNVLGPPPRIPTDVVNAAYQAIEPYADSSVEPGSADYTLAECHQLTDTSYRCMSQVRQKAGAPLMSIQLDVERYKSGRVVVTNLSRSRAPR